MRTISKLILGSVSALALGSTALAQDTVATPASSAARNAGGDDIIVTATKRAQSLQDVPISVAVTSAATIEKAQIRDLIDLQSVVPSLKVAQFNAAGQTNFIIRGFGNGNGNDGIESSVGVFIDGVYRSRSSSALDDLPEIERIEVLRGPQSTLFGKNVSAGAISIVTRLPQFEFGGQAEISFGNYGLIQSKATITGPLTDKLAVRLSATENKRDGYFTNVVTGTKINDRNRFSVRGDVLWQPTETLSLRVIADYNEIKELCCGVEQIQNGPATQFIGAPKPFGLGKVIGNTANVFARNVVMNTDPTNKLHGEGISAQADLDLGFAKLTSITAYRDQVNRYAQDVDFSAADLANRNDHNDIKTFTQEFRLASTKEGPLSWLLGGFYEDEKLLTVHDIRFGSDIRAYADGLSGTTASGPLAGRSNIFVLEYLQHLVTPSIIPGGTYFQAGQGYDEVDTVHQTSYSLFGQADYKVTDRLTLTAGLAYLNDRKRTAQNVTLQDPFSSLNLRNVPQLPFVGVPANAFAGLGALQFFYGDSPVHGPVNYPNANENGILTGDKVTYAARAAYDFGPINTYFSYSTGWKAGAVNLSTDSRPPDVNGIGRTAGPESVNVYEAGLKAKFKGGFFNLAVFKQTINNFQVNQYTGIAFALVNAGKESVKGFEIDSAYRPLDWLSLTGAVTYLDPKYDSFVHAPCVNYDTVRCPLDATGRRPTFRDLSGATPAGISKWNVSASATASQKFGDDLGGYLRAEYDFASNTQLTEQVPPGISTYGQHAINASAGITSDKLKGELMLWVRNLTNDKTLIGAFPTVAQDGSYSGYPNQPRTYGVTIRKRF